jgi:hypothetical protein
MDERDQYLAVKTTARLPAFPRAATLWRINGASARLATRRVTYLSPCWPISHQWRTLPCPERVCEIGQFLMRKDMHASWTLDRFEVDRVLLAQSLAVQSE